MSSKYPIPSDFMDLVNGSFVAHLSTIMPNGYPQTTPVWCMYEDGYLVTTTGKPFQKRKNMERNPNVTFFVYNPDNHLRYIEIRGKVETISEDNSIEYLDKLSLMYTGKAPYYGVIVDASLAETEGQVLVMVRPTRVNANDFSKESG